MTSRDYAHDPAQLRAMLECHGRNSDAWEAAGAAYSASPTLVNWARYQRAEAAFLATRRQMDAAGVADAVRRELKRILENN
jgi:hypothetical protein